MTALVAGAAIMLVTGGIAAGSPSTAQYEYGHPAPATSPTISGTPQVGQTLTTTNGTWTADSNITLYGYAWGRCDANGNGCVAIGGANASTYTLTDADQGHTIRSYVTATNSVGSTQTIVRPDEGGRCGERHDRQADRRLQGRPAEPARDRQGHVLGEPDSGAQVADDDEGPCQRLAPELRAERARVPARASRTAGSANVTEVRTDATGWATLQLQPAQLFPRTGYLVLFVRARVDGQDLLGGTSTRRLVQVTIAAPNGT